MSKITYFLGAGASALAIPVLNNFNNKLSEFVDFLLAEYLSKQQPRKGKPIPTVEQVKSTGFKPSELRDLGQGNYSNQEANLFSESFVYFHSIANALLIDLNQHTTVDTLARKYYLQQDINRLVQLKGLLIIYFLYLQKNEERFDKRYDTFVATILSRENNELLLPSNVGVISWNYDLQFELALKKYCKKTLSEVQVDFDISPRANNEVVRGDEQRFTAFKLNGTAGILYRQQQQKFIDIDNILEGQLELNELYELFNDMAGRRIKYNVDDIYRYSWETLNEDKKINNTYSFQSNIIQKAKDLLSESSTVVVIGYSFPAFNRLVDTELFDCLPNGTKIYIQDLRKDALDSFISLFDSLEERNIEVKPIEDVSQFYFPPVYFNT
jgi:hypothetical protein